MNPSPIYIFLSALSVGATLVFANLAREDMIEKQCFSANNSFFSGLAIACAGFARYVVSEDNPYISDEEIILAKLNSKPDGYHDPNELIETLNREVGEYKKIISFKDLHWNKHMGCGQIQFPMPFVNFINNIEIIIQI